MKACLHALLILALLQACDTTYRSSIPDSPVYIEVNLDYEDADLIPLQASKFFSRGQNINLAIESAGYGGVLVYHALDDNFYAFDAACPHEANPTAIVRIDEDRLHATCPKCESRYDLSYGNGNPVSGPSREALRRYTVVRSGSKLIVRH
ncbi:MAG: Rieske 2Fe-2S domain-containing protein [Tannerellaceae bacterium]|jgi:nitrite reductase/ring-hydroxylating ferredoxin subunit|nr:Rieske 2Fe-2S domain-containing protein [Tannerellaceae bacterium]